MTKNKLATQKALQTAKEVLEKTDKEKFPKLYESREANVKSLEIAVNQMTRAEKAEKKPSKKIEKKPDGDKTPKSNLSEEDLLALVDVPKEDRAEVKDYAKYKKISVEEALKAKTIITTLRESAEERETAAATEAGGNKKLGSKKASRSSMLNKFKETGEVPEKEEDMKELAEADMEEKVQESKSRRT